MTGAAFGREIRCDYFTESLTLWPEHEYCGTNRVDYSAKFEPEKHSFSISSSSAQKSEMTAFYIVKSVQVDYIPLDILTEFPNLNGLGVWDCNLPTLKSGLFRKEFKKIEYLDLERSKIESIEPEAFEYLVKLKWVNLGQNNLRSLPYRIFKNNPDLIYISLSINKIASIHPSFFDGLPNLKLVDFLYGNVCVKIKIGCETCLITQSDLRGKLQACFDNCSNGTTCHTAFLSYEASQTTTEKPIES
jgi:hypothetical protein